MQSKSYFLINMVFLMSILPTLGQASNVFNGKEVYLRECMACHGSAGEGAMPGLPNFTEDNTLYKNDAEIISIISDGKGVMPSFSGLMTDEDIRDVTAYVRTFL